MYEIEVHPRIFWLDVTGMWEIYFDTEHVCWKYLFTPSNHFLNAIFFLENWLWKIPARICRNIISNSQYARIRKIWIWERKRGFYFLVVTVKFTSYKLIIYNMVTSLVFIQESLHVRYSWSSKSASPCWCHIIFLMRSCVNCFLI